MPMDKTYHNDIMLTNAKELIESGKARVKITLIDDRKGKTVERGSEIYDIETLKKVYELILKEI